MDEKLIQATRLWTIAQPGVSAFVTSMVRDFRDRDDVLQEVAVAVFESFDSYDETRPFGAWVMGIARNQIRQYLRKRARDRVVFSEATAACLETAFADLAAKPSDRLDLLQECVGSLEGRAKRLCELRYNNDLKPAAIAGKLQMTANSVAKALQRVREQLRACVERKLVGEGLAR